MHLHSKLIFLVFLIVSTLSGFAQNEGRLGQVPVAQLTADQIVERASPSVALVLATRPAGETVLVGTALVVRENGVLLTTNHLIKDAEAVQIRFKSGEVFDTVQLLGVDERRDVAAIKISASGLPVLPIASGKQAKPGDAVTVVSHAAALPWSASTGIVAAYRSADEVPGAGSGYGLVQFTAPASPGSSGGVLIDAHGHALGLIVGSLMGAQNLNFAVPLENVLGLAESPWTKTFANGSAIQPPSTLIALRPIMPRPSQEPTVTPAAPEKSDLLKTSKDPDFILRNFKTMYVEAQDAQYFDSTQMKMALFRNDEFARLNIQLVDNPKVADLVLEVSYTFAWDYPFQLKHQNTSKVLLAGKGEGPFSGPAGAASVAQEFVNLARQYREQKSK